MWPLKREQLDADVGLQIHIQAVATRFKLPNTKIAVLLQHLKYNILKSNYKTLLQKSVIT
jgi:hypothetical protein